MEEMEVGIWSFERRLPGWRARRKAIDATSRKLAKEWELGL